MFHHCVTQHLPNPGSAVSIKVSLSPKQVIRGTHALWIERSTVSLLGSFASVSHLASANTKMTIKLIVEWHAFWIDWLRVRHDDSFARRMSLQRGNDRTSVGGGCGCQTWYWIKFQSKCSQRNHIQRSICSWRNTCPLWLFGDVLHVSIFLYTGITFKDWLTFIWARDNMHLPWLLFAPWRFHSKNR